jgi:hypothetical protein
MTRRLKTLAALGLPGLLLAGAVSLQRTYPAGGTGAGERDPGEELRRGAQLDEDRRFLLWANAAKAHVTAAVIRRRLGLLGGAAALHAIDAHRPAGLGPVQWDGLSGGSEEERYCQSLLGWVRQDRDADPARVAELEAELAEHLSRPEPMRLPDVALDSSPPAALRPAPDADEPGR